MAAANIETEIQRLPEVRRIGRSIRHQIYLTERVQGRVDSMSDHCLAVQVIGWRVLPPA